MGHVEGCSRDVEASHLLPTLPDLCSPVLYFTVTVDFIRGSRTDCLPWCSQFRSSDRACGDRNTNSVGLLGHRLIGTINFDPSLEISTVFNADPSRRDIPHH